MIWLLWAIGCQGERIEVPPPEPVSIGLAECAVCGMTAGEQPSPRGQVAHRDGTHLHTCSLADLRAYLDAPSARGEPVGVWVEALPSTLDPAASDTAGRPWVSVDSAFFVGGIVRTDVMGLPLLSYASQAEAEAGRAAWGGHTLTWAELRAVPFNVVPPKAP